MSNWPKATNGKPKFGQAKVYGGNDLWRWKQDGYDVLLELNAKNPSLDAFEAGGCFDITDPDLPEIDTNMAIKHAYDEGVWNYGGVIITLRRLDVEIAYESLWGIETDFQYRKPRSSSTWTKRDNSHLNEIVDEVYEQAKIAAKQKILDLAASLLNVSAPDQKVLEDTSQTPAG